MRVWVIAGIVALGFAGPLVAPLLANDTEEALESLNVNSRYTVESVHVLGVKMGRLSQPLRGELDHVVGQKLDHPRLDRIADQIKKELHVSDVTVHVERGATPERVAVDFEIKNSRRQNFDLNVARFLYNSIRGWTGEGRATTTVAGNSFAFGLVDDGDSLTERYAGIRAGYARGGLWNDRLRVSFDFASYHDEWNPATLNAADPGDIYRTRQSFLPLATVVLAAPLDLDFGADFARLQPAAGYAGASAKTESSNAVVTSLRYHRRWGSAQDREEQELRGIYSLRTATRILESDPVFTRHWFEARYKYRIARNTVEIGFVAGRITGDAPLYERFAAGNSLLLRGWNKYELDPLGGSHVVHGSVDYNFHGLLAFYDTGAIWDRGPQREQKQSVGVGYKAKDGFQLAMAFPVRDGHNYPVFYAGLNF